MDTITPQDLGAQINPAGLNINSDLPMSGNNLTLVRSVRFNVQSLPLSLPADLNCVYVAGINGDLYYNDSAGNQVQITLGGAVNATSSGISSGTASAAFSGGVLVVNADVTTPANIQGASILIGNNLPSSKFITLSAPSAMAANYTVTLPSLPSVTSYLTMDTSGNIASARFQ